MKLLLITDAWSPQTNGVVTTYKNVIKQLARQGIDTEVIHPQLFRTIACPGYAEIRLSINFWKIAAKIKQAQPDFIHIGTEGPLGLAARYYLRKHKLKYTTAFHTRFPEYINKRVPVISLKLGYRFMKWFHKHSQKILVTTPSMQKSLQKYGFDRMVVWGRGVDTELFKPNCKLENNLGDPIFLNVGRIAVEKNIEAFLKLDLPGKKIVVGDGPERQTLQKKYPDVEFAGYKYGEELAAEFARSDVFVFPSQTDTFGLVMLEAMSCGTPVAAYPVEGPIDVVAHGISGILHDDLGKAALDALKLKRSDCIDHARKNSWAACAQVLQDNLVDCQL